MHEAVVVMDEVVGEAEAAGSGGPTRRDRKPRRTSWLGIDAHFVSVETALVMEPLILRVVRFVALLVILFFIVSMITAIGRSETGWVEKAVLVGGVVGLAVLAATVRGLGSRTIGLHRP